MISIDSDSMNPGSQSSHESLKCISKGQAAPHATTYCPLSRAEGPGCKPLQSVAALCLSSQPG